MSFGISGDAISNPMESQAPSYEGHAAPAERGFCINKKNWRRAIYDTPGLFWRLSAPAGLVSRVKSCAKNGLEWGAMALKKLVHRKPDF